MPRHCNAASTPFSLVTKDIFYAAWMQPFCLLNVLQRPKAALGPSICGGNSALLWGHPKCPKMDMVSALPLDEYIHCLLFGILCHNFEANRDI